MKSKCITIGIDPGNDSTKVVYRATGDDIQSFTRIYEFATADSGTPGDTYPSRISIANGKLYFGDEALERAADSDGFFASVKNCLGCFNRISECRDCLERGFNSFRRGIFIYQGRDVSAFDLTVFYLAYIMRRVRSELYDIFGEGEPPEFIYNIAFPGSYLMGRRRLFEYGVASARALSVFMYQGIQLTLAYQYLEYLSERVAIATPGDTPTAFAVSQSRATACAITEGSSLPEGFYCLADIGSGSTHLLLLRFIRKADAKPAITYWAERCINIASREFERRIDEYVRDFSEFLRKDTHPRGYGIHRNKYVNILFCGRGSLSTGFEKIRNAAMGAMTTAHWGPRELQGIPPADPPRRNAFSQPDRDDDFATFQVARGLSFPCSTLALIPPPTKEAAAAETNVKPETETIHD